jgi:hypothetical protein
MLIGCAQPVLLLVKRAALLLPIPSANGIRSCHLLGQTAFRVRKVYATSAQRRTGSLLPTGIFCPCMGCCLGHARRVAGSVRSALIIAFVRRAVLGTSPWWILQAVSCFMGRWPGDAERVQAGLAPHLPPSAEITVSNYMADPQCFHAAFRIVIS